MSELLRPHQEAGAVWLAERMRAYLGDAPRVGKTRTLLSAAARVGARMPLVICPAIVRTHWIREAHALGLWAPLVMSYDAAVRRGFPWMQQVMLLEPDLLILDEAHRCKNPSAQRTQIVLGKDGYARRIARVWAASGTPMPKNNPVEFWPQLAALDFPRMRSAGFTTSEEWRTAFAKTYERWNPFKHEMEVRVTGVQNAERMREVIAPIFLRRELSDLGVETPPLEFQRLLLDGERVHPDKATDERVRAAAAAGDLGSIEKDPLVARARHALGTTKAHLLVDYLTPYLAEDPSRAIAVFAYHRDALNILRSGLNHFGMAYVDGDTGDTARDLAQQAFQSGVARIFLGQSTACREGITLDRASEAFILEPDWTAGYNEQVGNRIMATHSAERRTVQMVTLANTLDEAIVGVNLREQRMGRELAI